jgi:hypothetical protein
MSTDLAAHFARIAGYLANHARRLSGETVDDVETQETTAPFDGPFDELAITFSLSDFERDVVAMCAAVELDASIAQAVRLATDSPDARPTIGLLLSCLPGAHWDALSTDRPLQGWQLVNLSTDGTLTTRRAAIDERILHQLLGITAIDRRLDGTVVALPAQAPLFPSHDEAAERLAKALIDQRNPTLVNLHGTDETTARSFATQVSYLVGSAPIGVLGEALPGPGPVLHDITRLIDREWILSRRLPVICGIAANPSSVSGMVGASLAPLLFSVSAPVEVLGAASSRLVLHESIPTPRPAEQRQLLMAALDETAQHDEHLVSTIDQISQRHRLNSETITSIGADVLRHPPEDRAERLHMVCRERSRTQLDSLARRITTTASWADIVLAEGHLHLLKEIAQQVKHRTQVYDNWGFGDRSSRGLGVTALFAGESGTGKTLAAEVIANELSLDLFRVDLAATVSKYIGETEKNLGRLFDAAEGSGAVLLFDEADALFGKRTEVRDSHDRYANLEVAYLLQRMETYRGLAILTTNLRSNLDRAFVRRLRFVVQFPFPEEAERAEIWRRTFPDRTPLEGVKPESLAKLTIPGGSIWSIALSAAFAAADDGSPVTPAHLLTAAGTEYAKGERTLTATEMAALT